MKTMELGLSTTYRERGTVHTIISKLLALPFLPGDQIKRAFTKLKERADTSSKPVADLFTYVNDRWMENSCWSPEEWSVYKQTVRTNNDTEGYHRGLNHKAGRGKLAFYVLIPILHQEAKMVDYTVNLVAQEIICRIRRAVYQSLDKRISELWDDYDHHELRTEEFLQKVGEIYGRL
ncbi:uncharacterized protein LOC132759936 [Ruditapes philippinarum]|uniref:uncharacterized protein LOC132759936 n=1 Tax=Ruditapes philippinarum TaxID=129788 RepID=UPI00295B5A7B|nr:uncharacterized protein LOC132759936 [Ruditapes philippinarum]